MERKPPNVTGQRARVLELIRKHRQIISFDLTSAHAIPCAYARITELRQMGFNIVTTILEEVVFQGKIRRNVARYSLGVPEWTPPPEAEALTKKENE